MNFYFLLAALADLTAVVAHGVSGHRIILSPLTPEQPFSTRAFGEADMSRRALLVAWHMTTAAFACSAVARGLLAFGVVASAPVPPFLSAMHASYLLVGLWVLRGRFGHLLRPIPLTFITCMGTVCLMGWLGSR